MIKKLQDAHMELGIENMNIFINVSYKTSFKK